MRNIIAIFLLLASIGIYYGFTGNVFSEITTLRAQVDGYDSALSTAKQVEEEQTKLNDTIKKFDPDNLKKLNVLLPDHADNVRLIIDMQNIAKQDGLTIKNIKVNDQKNGEAASISQDVSGSNSAVANKYGTLTISFSVVSTYPNFLTYLSHLEKSLRLVDITSLSLTSTDNPNIYNFDVSLKAYWLK